MPPGRYTLGGQEVELSPAGRVAAPGAPNLAGSALRLDVAIGNTVRFTGLPLEEVVPMASTRPAEYVGIPDRGQGRRRSGTRRPSRCASCGSSRRGRHAMGVKRSGPAVLVLAIGVVWPALARGQAQPPVPPPPPLVEGLPLAGEEAEAFLRTARVLDRTPIGKGITRPDRDDADRRHADAAAGSGRRSTNAGWACRGSRAAGYEFDFRDSWKSEVAAYELDKLLGLRPRAADRRAPRRRAAPAPLQMWVEAAMTEDESQAEGPRGPGRGRAGTPRCTRSASCTS